MKRCGGQSSRRRLEKILRQEGLSRWISVGQALQLQLAHPKTRAGFRTCAGVARTVSSRGNLSGFIVPSTSS